MFDGTDLSMAYGSIYESSAPPAPIVQSVKPQQPTMEIPQSTASHSQAPEVSYQPPAAMYVQQPATSQQHTFNNVNDVSFWDKLATKRPEVLKLFMFALVVLLALSMDHIASHYLANYISKTILTDMQELFVRLSYPVMIFLVIWIMKAA